MLAAVCVVVVGCGGTTTPDDPPASDTPTSGVSGPPSAEGEEPPAPDTPDDQEENPDPPGVPGSPIDYDSTLLHAPGITLDGVKSSIEGDLESKCETNRCGIKVVIQGSGKCAVSIGPDPVSPGQTVTIVAGECSSGEESPGSDEVTPPSEDDIPSSEG